MQKDEELRSQLDVSVTSCRLVLAQPRLEAVSKFGLFCRMMSMPRLETNSNSNVTTTRPGFDPETKFRSESDLASEAEIKPQFFFTPDPVSELNFGSDPGLSSGYQDDCPGIGFGTRRTKHFPKPEKLEIIVDEDDVVTDHFDDSDATTKSFQMNR